MEKLAIIGCGTMGHSIALNAAMAEIPVKMYGIDEGDIARGKAGILKNLTTLSDHGFMDTDKALIISSKIITTTSINEVIEDSTYVIEAIPEDLNLKMNFFQNLDKLCNEDIILASNTSGLSPTVVYSIGRRLCMTGPLVSADMGGLDVFSSISDYLFSDLCNTNASFTSIKDLVKDNKLGSKSGQGFYNWDKAFTEKMNNKRDAELIRFLKLD